MSENIQKEPIPVGKPLPGNSNPAAQPAAISEADKNKLKQQGFAYMPKQLDTIAAQKQILAMLAGVLPPVRVCQEKADRETWPKAERGELPMNHAVAQCAYEVNTLIGMTLLDNLGLEKQNREALLKGWIALDYYCYVLNPSFTANLHRLQDRLSGILLAGVQKAAPVQPPVRQDVRVPENKAVVEKPANKKRIGAILGALVAVVALAAGIWFYSENLSPVAKTEQAIEAIGTVTMESEDAILAAEELYTNLAENKQKKVENSRTLLDARKEYDRMEGAIQKAVDAIKAIGTVSLDSGDSIRKAWTAYDALKTDNLTSYVSKEYTSLVKADKEYASLCAGDLLATAQEKQKSGSYQEAKDAYQTILTQYSETDSVADAKTGIMDCTAALAQAQIKTNDLEGAYKLLEEVTNLCSHTQDYTKAQETLQQRLKQVRPTNGKVFKNKVDWGWGKLTLEAPSDQDVLFKVQSVDDAERFVLVYVQAGKETEVSLKDGTYHVKYTTGENWFSQDSMFGSDASFYKSTSTYWYTTTIEGRYVYYYARTASLNKSSSDYFIGTTIKAEEF